MEASTGNSVIDIDQEHLSIDLDTNQITAGIKIFTCWRVTICLCRCI